MRTPVPLRGQSLAPVYASNWCPSGVLWATGFRPFFLLAPMGALVSLGLWALNLQGVAPSPAALPGVLWHVHEMVFGYTLAVVAGFLLTAVPKWTGTRQLKGRPVMALAALWLLGRLAMLAPVSGPLLGLALLDLLFLPALTLAVGTPILGTGNVRNYGFVVLLAVLTLVNTAMHCSALGYFDLPGARYETATGAIGLMMAIIGGRVIPQFTANRLGITTGRSPLFAKAGLGLASAALASDLAGLPQEITAPLALGAGAALFLRMRGWHTRDSLRVPMLWILHIGYAWVALAFFLRGLSLSGAPVSASVATHAMTAGAVGSMTLGMMARVGLGHSGRRIAAPRWIVTAFGLVIAAALLRVGAPLVAPLLGATQLAPAHGLAALLWCAAQGLFLWVYLPVLTRPRVDGWAG